MARLAHIIHPFRGYGRTLDGFTQEGILATADGLTLAPDSETSKSEEGDTFRRGTLESPPLPFDFPSNGVEPIWHARTPEGTAVYVELALSIDAQNWGPWQGSTPTGDEIAPTYPDGNPNPNYGGEIGGALINGSAVYPFVKYRITMTSTGENTPVLEQFKLTYLDSTEGQAPLASPDTDVYLKQNASTQTENSPRES